MTDGQTDRRTGEAIAYTRYSIYAVARNYVKHYRFGLTDTYIVICDICYYYAPPIRTAKLLKSVVTQLPLFYCALSHINI